MYIDRKLEKIIEPYLKRKEVLAVVGPRQAGKTTILKRIQLKFEKNAKKVRFITFEDRSELAIFNDNVEDFREMISDYDVVIIDEFQLGQEGGQKLKYLFDTTSIKFIISGSSSFEIKHQTGKYMVGRMLNFDLFPLSFREYLSFKKPEYHNMLVRKQSYDDIFRFESKNGFGQEINNQLASELEKFVVFGGYPAVVLSETEEEKKKTLEAIVENYLLRDIKNLLGLITDDELMKIGKFLATQIGSLVVYEELCNASGLNYKEVLKHLNILEKTYIIKLLKPFYRNKRTELVKSPKSFFVDLGMRNCLLADFRKLSERNDFGSVMENYAHVVMSEIFSEEIKFWRTKNKAEVDFVIEREGNVYPIEVKYTSKRIVGKSFYSFVDKFKPKIGIILTKDYLGEEMIGGTLVKFIPLGYLGE